MALKDPSYSTELCLCLRNQSYEYVYNKCLCVNVPSILEIITKIIYVLIITQVFTWPFYNTRERGTIILIISAIAFPLLLFVRYLYD